MPTAAASIRTTQITPEIQETMREQRPLVTSVVHRDITQIAALEMKQLDAMLKAQSIAPKMYLNFS